MAFAVCAAGVPLAHRLLHRPGDPPRSLSELAGRMRQSNPPLYVVPMTDSSLEEGIYLCELPQPREQLQLLRHLPEYRDRCRGIVFCEKAVRLGEIEESQWQQWGEHSMRAGTFVFFGDPALLNHIRRAIPEE
jgi:hypothetical protein